SGTARDPAHNNLSSMAGVGVVIRRLDKNTTYWNDVTQQWDVAQTTNDTQGTFGSPTVNWSFPPSDVSFWVANISYTLTSIARDDSNFPVTDGNKELVPQVYSFVYDTLPPLTTIQAPFAGEYYNKRSKQITTLSGTALDNAPGSLDRVIVRIESGTTGNYWTGGGWT